MTFEAFVLGTLAAVGPAPKFDNVDEAAWRLEGVEFDVSEVELDVVLELVSVVDDEVEVMLEVLNVVEDEEVVLNELPKLVEVEVEEKIVDVDDEVVADERLEDEVARRLNGEETEIEEDEVDVEFELVDPRELGPSVLELNLELELVVEFDSAFSADRKAPIPEDEAVLLVSGPLVVGADGLFPDDGDAVDGGELK